MRGGFTLIELLMSVVILSTGIVVVLGAFQTSLTALAESRESMLAGMLLRQTLSDAETALGTGAGKLASGSGSFPREFKDYRWRRDVRSETATQEGGGRVLGRNVEVTMHVWREGSGARARATQLFFVKEPEG